jgi:hypothetical protein
LPGRRASAWAGGRGRAAGGSGVEGAPHGAVPPDCTGAGPSGLGGSRWTSYQHEVGGRVRAAVARSTNRPFPTPVSSVCRLLVGAAPRPGGQVEPQPAVRRFRADLRPGRPAGHHRPPRRLAVGGGEAVSGRLVQNPEPIREALPELLWVNQCEDAAEGVMGGNPVGARRGSGPARSTWPCRASCPRRRCPRRRPRHTG